MDGDRVYPNLTGLCGALGLGGVGSGAVEQLPCFLGLGGVGSGAVEGMPCLIRCKWLYTVYSFVGRHWRTRQAVRPDHPRKKLRLIASIHVAWVGNPAAAWRYLIILGTALTSYTLLACGFCVWEMAVCFIGFRGTHHKPARGSRIPLIAGADVVLMVMCSFG